MYKPIKILVVCVIFIAVMFIFLVVFWFCYNRNVPDNNDFDKEINTIVKTLVDKSLKIQHKVASIKSMKNIFTEELQKEILEEGYYFKKGKFYLVNRDYMESLGWLNDNELIVGLRVRDLIGNEHMQTFIFTRQLDGTYLISKIEFDI